MTPEGDGPRDLATPMKRTFAVVALLAALGVLLKLAVKEGPTPLADRPTAEVASDRPAPDPDAALAAGYADPAQRALVERVVKTYGHNARAIARSDGLRGLTLLDKLGLEAVFLYEKYPKEFRKLRDSLSDDAAADLLLHWREYFALKRHDDADRNVLIAEVARLAPAQRRAAARYPNALPLILAEPAGVTDLIRRWEGDPDELRDALVALDFISLEPGAADLRAALRILDAHGPTAVEAFRLQGPEGLALVGLYGPVLDALAGALPLESALILLKVNTGYVDELLQTRRPEVVAGYLKRVAAAGLVEAVGGSPNALRLAVEYGDRGERALAQAGPDAADVVFEEYTDATLRNQAVAALAEHGPMALAMLAKYAADPDFRDILRAHGPPIIPPIARADAGPETLAALRAKSGKSFTETLARGVLALSGDNGQATIRTIKADGLERVAELDSSELQFYQFLPLYDLVHLGRVVGKGYTPTSGEMTWALVDGCFVVADILSLTAAHPEGAVAAEVAHSELEATAREAAKTIGRELAEEGAQSAGVATGRRAAGQGSEAATGRLVRWWAVRRAGGIYKVLHRTPEAMERLALSEIGDLSRRSCAKAGFRLVEWRPLHFFLGGREVLRRIPPKAGIKYLAAQALQAGAGVVAFHKMEEHLASRRP
jgi:hypothetical protein